MPKVEKKKVEVQKESNKKDSIKGNPQIAAKEDKKQLFVHHSQIAR